MKKTLCTFLLLLGVAPFAASINNGINNEKTNGASAIKIVDGFIEKGYHEEKLIMTGNITVDIVGETWERCMDNYVTYTKPDGVEQVTMIHLDDPEILDMVPMNFISSYVHNGFRNCSIS